MITNSRFLVARLFARILDFILDVGRWTADMAGRLWTTARNLTSAGLDRADKWIRPPTLSIVFEDHWMRVLVVHRKRVIAWDTFSRPTPFSAPAVNAEPQNSWLAHRLKAFLKSNRITRVHAVTSVPLRSTLLREVQLPSISQQYMRGVIASELEETIPFATEDVDIAWRVNNSSELSTARAIVVPRTVTDESVEAVREADVELSAIFSEAEAMAHAVGEDGSLVVRLADRHASLALVIDGSPKMVHRVQYDPASLDQPEQLDSLITSLEYLASNSGLPGRGARRVTSLRVVLMGSEADVTPLRRSLALHFPAQALPTSPIVKTHENFPMTEYAVNLGLAAAWDSKIKQGKFRRVEVGLNLLQERHTPSRMPVRSGAAVAMLFILVGLALTATFKVQDTETQETALSRRASSMERQFRLRWGRANKIHDDAEAARSVNQQLDGVLTQLRAETDTLMNRILAITRTASAEGMSVPKLSPEGREFVVAGTASSFDDVFDYAAGLRKTGLFDDVLVLRLDAVDPTGSGGAFAVAAVLFQVKVLVSTEGSILRDDQPGVESKNGELKKAIKQR